MTVGLSHNHFQLRKVDNFMPTKLSSFIVTNFLKNYYYVLQNTNKFVDRKLNLTLR